MHSSTKNIQYSKFDWRQASERQLREAQLVYEFPLQWTTNPESSSIQYSKFDWRQASERQLREAQLVYELPLQWTTNPESAGTYQKTEDHSNFAQVSVTFFRSHRWILHPDLRQLQSFLYKKWFCGIYSQPDKISLGTKKKKKQDDKIKTSPQLFLNYTTESQRLTFEANILNNKKGISGPAGKIK